LFSIRRIFTDSSRSTRKSERPRPSLDLGGFVVHRTGLDRSQVRAGVGLGEDHRAGHFPARELRQDPLFGLLAGVFFDRGGDLLQAEDRHQAALGPGDDLDHHLIDRFGEVQPAVLPGEHATEQLGLAQRPDRVAGRRGVFHLAVGEVDPLLVGFGRARRHLGGADFPQHLEDRAVVVYGVGVITRRGGVVGGFGVALFL
jgi:hypothetical protein